MKIKLKYETCDYREAQELFAKFKQQGTSYCTYDYPSKTYKIELEKECNTEAEQYRWVLQQMFLNSYTEEEKDALSYADSAIKTLIDMGVLK
jgi:hypothetical protein